MKLLLITTTYPTPTRPRQGAFVREMVRGLSLDHEVKVIAPIPWTEHIRASGPMAPTDEAIHPTYYYPPKLLRSTYGSWYWHSIRFAVKRLRRDFRPDIVMGYWAHPDGEAALRAARLCEVPLVLQVGGSDVRLLAHQPWRGERIRRVLCQSDRIVTCSGELASQVRALGVSPSRIDIHYRGIDRDVFRPGDQNAARRRLQLTDERPLILWVGRFEAVKNPRMFLEAASHWRTIYGPEFTTAMIGEGRLAPSIKAEAQRLGLGNCCRFPGGLPQDRLADWYRAADVMVLTSHSEGVPNVLLESIACNTPFVATDVGGVSEIASSGIDELVPSGDASRLARAVVESLNRTTAAKRRFIPSGTRQAAIDLGLSLQRAIHPPSQVMPSAPARESAERLQARAGVLRSRKWSS